MKQDPCVIQFQDIRLAAKFRGVVDPHTVLDKRFIAAQIAWLVGIDRYLKEDPTSAAQGFQRYREDGAPYTLEMVAQFLGENRTHVVSPPPCTSNKLTSRP